ncbi:hypothetical protein Q0M94_28455 (plasmid) [Deinococcus radiomollis]|uniref:hypothetical protein n=1 Tax=Deinococcus radiomollis TaxID=468916 RepID=UPI00389122EF
MIVELTEDQIRAALTGLNLWMPDADESRYPLIESTANTLRRALGLADEQMYERDEEAA